MATQDLRLSDTADTEQASRWLAYNRWLYSLSLMLGLTDYFEISSFILDFYMYCFQPFTRYGQHVKTLANYDGKDLLRLSKDDLILLASFSWWSKNQMDWKLSQVGPVDGVRLHNDLERIPVSRPDWQVAPRPRWIFDAWLCRISLISGCHNEALP